MYRLIDYINKEESKYELVESDMKTYRFENEGESLNISITADGIGIIKDNKFNKMHLLLSNKTDSKMRIHNKEHDLKATLDVRTIRIENELPERIRISYDILYGEQSGQQIDLEIIHFFQIKI